VGPSRKVPTDAVCTPPLVHSNQQVFSVALSDGDVFSASSRASCVASIEGGKNRHHRFAPSICQNVEIPAEKFLEECCSHLLFCIDELEYSILPKGVVQIMKEVSATKTGCGRCGSGPYDAPEASSGA
jgi:hypothetical protein